MKKTIMSDKNKKFWALPKEKQRIAVAKDVIKQLRASFYNPQAGTYVEYPVNEKLQETAQLDKVFTKLKRGGEQCNVCGLGACFVSMVRLGDNAETGKFMGKKKSWSDVISVKPPKMRTLLRKIFPASQLSLIESAFEQTLMRDGKDRSKDVIDKLNNASRFWETFGSEDEHVILIAIMENIIENNGEFVLPEIEEEVLA